MTSATPSSSTTSQLPASDGSSDPHERLEEVTGEEARAWVSGRTRRAAAERQAVAARGAAQGTRRAETRQRASRESRGAKDKIPGVIQRGDHLYNCWTDADHERGLW